MKQRLWTVHRQAVSGADAQFRWDRAYQFLVMWSCRQNDLPTDWEEHHENGSVCTSLQCPAGSDSNHRRATASMTDLLPQPSVV